MRKKEYGKKNTNSSTAKQTNKKDWQETEQNIGSCV
jgi:hypothetical protein